MLKRVTPLVSWTLSSCGEFLCVFAVALSLSVVRLETARPMPVLGADYENLLDFSAPKPFVLRFIIPLIARLLMDHGGIDEDPVFGVFECFALIGIYYALRRLFAPLSGNYAARALAGGMFFIVPFFQLLNLPSAYYNPSDTPALCILGWGIVCIFERRWRWVFPLIAFGTCNRETTLIIPFLAAAIYWRSEFRREALLNVSKMLAVYGSVRLLVGMWFRDSPGNSVMLHRGEVFRAIHNFDWLMRSPVHIFILFATFAFLPGLLVLCRKDLPELTRPFLIVFSLFFGLYFFVANIYESRVFGELILLLYIPAALGVFAKLQRVPLVA